MDINSLAMSLPGKQLGGGLGCGVSREAHKVLAGELSSARMKG